MVLLFALSQAKSPTHTRVGTLEGTADNEGLGDGTPDTEGTADNEGLGDGTPDGNAGVIFPAFVFFQVVGL